MTLYKEWWKDFFPGLWLEVQGKTRIKDKTKTEANFIDRLFKLTPPAKILDVPCGEGRLALELATKGYQVTGVDFTLPLLDDAQKKASKRGLKINWENRDMRDLPWHNEFDGAFCFGGSFGYFDDKENIKFLKAVYRILKPKARFLIDVVIAETLLPKFQERDWQQIGQIFVLQKRHYDVVRSRIDAEWILIKGDKIERKFSSMRIYTYRESCELLQQVGFENLKAYGSLKGEPLKLGQFRLYLLATKKSNKRR